MDDKDKFRELLEHFVGTEKASPALLELLEQRLLKAIGHEIDAEIVRHSFLIHAYRPRSASDHSYGQLSKSKKMFLDEFCFTDSESSSRSPGQSFPNNTRHSLLMIQHEIQRISDQLAQHSQKLRIFRAEALEECKNLVKSLWKIQQKRDNIRKGKKGGFSVGIFPQQNHLNGFDTFSPQFLPPMQFAAAGDGHKSDDEVDGHYYYDSGDNEEESEEHNAVVELNAFSLDHSMQEWPEEEMQNIVWLICSDGMEQSVRLTNIQKLHFVSPIAFSKSKAFEIFLGHLHAILPLPLLFNETMHILARIMNCPNEMIWLKSVNCLSRVAHGVMRSSSLDLNDKISFADFFRQIFCYGPQIWRNFEPPIICRIVHDLVEMLTVEISAGGGGGPSPDGFLAMLARVDPEALWLLPWFHRRSILKLMMPKFSELINEILDHHGRDHLKEGDMCRPNHSPLFWAFEASVIFRCLQHLPVFAFLREIMPDFAELRNSFCRAILHFLTLVFTPSIATGSRPKGFGMARRIVVHGLLETTTSDCGAAVLSNTELFLNPLFSMPSSVGVPFFVFQMPSRSSVHSSLSSFSPIFDLCLKVLLNVLLFAPPSLPPSGDVSLFLSKVEQHLRHHLTMFIHHNDNPFSNQITVQFLNALFEHFPIDQLRSAFSDLIRTFLTNNITKLDHSNPNHRRLIVSIACLTFIDNNSTKSALQWSQWQKNVGKLLSKIALRNYSPIFAGEISPINPHKEWATFPSAIELNESEKQLTEKALLQFVGFQQRDDRVQESIHHQKPKSVQNAKIVSKIRQNGRPPHYSAHVSMTFGRCETDNKSSKNVSSSADDDCSQKCIEENTLRCMYCLDFLPSAPTDFRPENCHSEPLPSFIYFLITQPELSNELLHFGQFWHYLLKQFTSFERLKDAWAEQRMIQFIGNLDILIINFDVLTELRHFVPNLGAKIVELLHKYCSDSSGNLLMSELSRSLCLFLSHSFIASPSTERRFCKFERIGQINAALANIPKSNYQREKSSKRCEENGEEKSAESKRTNDHRTENSSPEEMNDFVESATKQTATEQHQHLLMHDYRNHFELVTVFRKNAPRTVSMQMEEKDFPFWFAVLPEKDTDATRHTLLQTLFSSSTVGDGNAHDAIRMKGRPFEVLNKFAAKFWAKPEKNRMTMKPNQHSEWLSFLADFAHGLALTRGTRATVRKQIGTIRLLQQIGRTANDWFVAALFLSSGLSAEATSDFCERLLECRRTVSLSTDSSLNVDLIWPVCCSVSPSSAVRSFSELLALRVFPLVLSLVRHCPDFLPLRGFLSSCQIPSLFHLLLFYTNQSYLGILPFQAVQEYLAVAVLGGPQFQALHFCAVLAHIFHSSTRNHSFHFSSKLTSLFLRPIFLADFCFSKYAFIRIDG